MTLLLAHLSLALSAFLSATLLPGTSEVALLALIAKWPEHGFTFFVVATFANSLGSSVNWVLGRGINHFADRRWLPVSRQAVERASDGFQRYGIWVLLFSWVPVIGDPLTLVAGALRVHFLPFIVLVVLGKAARYALLLWGFLSL